jgi:ATP-dependent exoDNAse (exonuclease V) beta subunit
MPDKIFNIFRSSAGSGKTWNLAFQYVKLALQTPGNFRNILAVTFTNKATAEMKERILESLQHLSQDHDPGLTAQMAGALRIDRALVRQRAQTALDDIMHHYSQFSVSTIDAFFQKIIRGFAREIGMLGNYRVEMDVNRVLDEVIDMTLADAGTDNNLTRWLVDFAATRVEAGEVWDIRKNLASLSGQLFTEQYRRVQHNVHAESKTQAEVKKLHAALLKVKHAYENQLRQSAEEALNLIHSAGRQVEDFKYGQKGPAGFFQKLMHDADTSVNAYVRAALENRQAWLRKGSDEESLLAVLDRGLDRILHETVQYMEHHGTLYRSAKHFLRYIHSYALLAEILIRVDQYRAENGLMLISDVNAFLRGIIGQNDAPFIYEKTGSRYRHYLIDEFQDTSVFQWENFRPLIENGIAEGYQSLVVGDGKQSIYRWRSGEWELLNNHIPHVFDHSITSVTALEVNYRSAPDIVAFNNLLFQKLPQAIEDLLTRHGTSEGDVQNTSEHIERLNRNLRGLYGDAHQSPVKAGDAVQGGYVQLTFRENSASLDAWRESVLEDLERRINDVLVHGYHPVDIAILVRNKEEGRQVVQYLMAQRGRDHDPPYDVVSSESLYLGNSHAVRIVINGLKYMATPEDPLALANLRYEYFLMTDGDGRDPGPLFTPGPEDGPDHFEANFQDALGDILEENLPTQIEAMIRFFKLEHDASNAAYLMGLQDAVRGYLNDNPEGPAAFFQWWDEEGQYLSVQVPEAPDAIQVLTVHKSKGLQFPVVMVPFCNWPLDHNVQHDNFLWVSSAVPPFDKAGHIPVRYSAALAETVFREDYLQEMGKVFVDNLNLLYVAFTRAENALYADCMLPGVETFGLDRIRKVSDLLYYFFREAREVIASGHLWSGPCTVEENVLHIGVLPEPTPRQQMGGLRHLEAYHSFVHGDRIRIRKQGDDIFGAEWKSRVDYGILVHSVLSELRVETDVEETLIRMQDQGKLSSDELPTLRDALSDVLSIPEVRLWFSPGWNIFAEMPIITHSGRQWQPDRVVVSDERTLVIDFKTGAEDNTHHRQVRKYRELLQEMGYCNVEAYLLYIANKKVIRVA